MARTTRSDDNAALGAAIRERRLENGMSQEALGFAADLHRTYVGRCERGEASVGLHSLVRLARALGLTPSELVRRYEEVAGRGGPPG
jgi:transcriptional regulator with XRE-family HTH domain